MKEDKWPILCSLGTIQISVYILYIILSISLFSIEMYYAYRGLMGTMIALNITFTIAVLYTSMYSHAKIGDGNINLILVIAYKVFVLTVTLFIFIFSTILYSQKILPSSIYGIACTLSVLHLITSSLVMHHAYIIEDKTFRCCSNINEEAKNELNENKTLL